MPNVKDITGEKFSRATALRFVGIRRNRAQWLCRCECGREFVATGIDLRSGNTKSCGCYCADRTREASVTHGANLNRGMSGTYKSWRNMRQRCYDPNVPRYSMYGGRGIKVCDRWKDYLAFLEDMGERPEGYSLERIDVDGDYEPGNCEWIPREHQAKNQTTTVRWVLDGEIVIQAEAARRLGTHPSNLLHWRKRPSAMPANLRPRLKTLTT